MNFFYHEQLHRGDDVMARLGETRITICGAGALGANLAESLARCGAGSRGDGCLEVIDHDRVEERNLSTQPYERADVGASKARILAGALYRAVGARVEARATRLEERNVRKLLRGADLVIDAFDNSVSRRLVRDFCRDASQPCLHAGLASAYSEVIWNDLYQVPSEAQDDVCDYPLARNLTTLTVAVACEVILAFLASGEQASFTVTLDDFAIRPYG